MSFEGKIAVVTGGAQGIGAACAEALLNEGADVVLADINDERMKQTAAQFGEKFPQRRICVFQVDTRSQAQCFAMGDYAVQELGRIDVMVNAAGIVSPCPSLDVTEADWLNLIGINLNGVFYSCQAAGRAMRDSGRGGAIVNLSSIAAETAWPGRTSYAASKAGVMLMTKSLALEWAPLGIRVNAVGPAWTNTELLKPVFESGVLSLEDILSRIPTGRLIETHEVADAVLFLASDKASSITGQTIYVDGGYMAGRK